MYENAKAFMKSYQKARKRADLLKMKLERVECRIGGGAVNYDGMPHSTVPSSPTERDAMILADTKAELKRARADEREAMRRVMSTIRRLEDSMHYVILYSRYIEALDWDEIANEIGYTIRHTHRLHARALCEVQMMLGGFEK